VGRLSSSHSLTIGRSMSRTMLSASSALRTSRLADKAPKDKATASFASGDSNASSLGSSASAAGSASTACGRRQTTVGVFASWRWDSPKASPCGYVTLLE